MSLDSKICSAALNLNEYKKRAKEYPCDLNREKVAEWQKTLDSLLVEKEIEKVTADLIEKGVRLDLWNTDIIRCVLTKCGDKRFLRLKIDYYDAHKDNSNVKNEKCKNRYLQVASVIFADEGEILYFDMEDKIEPKYGRPILEGNRYDSIDSKDGVLINDDEDLLIRSSYIGCDKEHNIYHFKKKDNNYELVGTVDNFDNRRHPINLPLPFKLLKTGEDSKIGSFRGRLYDVKNACFLTETIFDEVCDSNNLDKIGLLPFAPTLSKQMKEHNLLIGEYETRIDRYDYGQEYIRVYAFINAHGEIVGDVFYYNISGRVFRHVPTLSEPFWQVVRRIEKIEKEYNKQKYLEERKRIEAANKRRELEKVESENRDRILVTNIIKNAFPEKTLEYKPKEAKKED